MIKPNIHATGLLLLVLAGPVAAQTPGIAPDFSTPGWTPWFGCWEAVGDSPLAGTVHCFLPGTDAASARVVRLEGDSWTDVETLRTDGVASTVEADGCVEVGRGSTSADGARVYLSSELECEGLRQSASRVLAFLSEAEWLDAESRSLPGTESVQAVRYRLLDPALIPDGLAAELPPPNGLARSVQRLAASRPLAAQDVVEASTYLTPSTLEALLAARGDGFEIDAALLEELEAGEVSDRVIDLMVALSFPERFQVEERWVQTTPYADPGPVAYGTARWDDCADPYDFRFRTDRRCGAGYGFYGPTYGWSPYGYRRNYLGYGYGWDPYGLGFGYPFGYGGRPIIVIVSPGDQPTQPQAVAVRGQGYTRGGAPPAASGSAAPRPAPVGPPTSPRPAASASSGSTRAGGSSGATRTSTASGSGSGSTRTAVPRPADP